MTKIRDDGEPVVYEKLTSTQQRCYELLMKCGVFELRAIARVFGNTSPTTAKRNDHIRVIMDKIISGEDLRPAKVKQGRPYKELNNVTTILKELSTITGKDYVTGANTKKTIIPPIKNFMFRQDEADIVKQKLRPKKVSGVVIEKNENDYFIINQTDEAPILIKKSQFGEILQENDFITGTAVVMNNLDEYILDEVDTINFVKAKEFVRKSVSNDLIAPTKTMKLGNATVFLGSRYILEMRKFTDDIEKMQKVVATLKQNNILTIAIVPNVIYEEEALVRLIGFDNAFCIYYGRSNKETNSKLRYFINNIQALQEQGNSIAIFVQDPVTIANCLDVSFRTSSRTTFNHTDETSNLIRDIVLLAKNTKAYSTTLFTTYEDVDKTDPLFVSSIYKVSTKVDL